MKKMIIALLALGTISAHANCLESIVSISINKNSINLQGASLSSKQPAEITYYFTSNESINEQAMADSVKALKYNLVICNVADNTNGRYFLELEQ